MEGEGQSPQPSPESPKPKHSWTQRLGNTLFGLPKDKPLFGIPDNTKIPAEDKKGRETTYTLKHGIQTPEDYQRVVKAGMYGSDVGKYLLTADAPTDMKSLASKQAQSNRFEMRGIENQRTQALRTRTMLQEYDSTLQTLIDNNLAEKVPMEENEDPGREQYRVKAPHGNSSYTIIRSIVRGESGQPIHGDMEIQRYWDNNLRETINLTVPEKDVWENYSIRQTPAVRNPLGYSETNYPVANWRANRVVGRLKKLLPTA